MNLNRRAFLTSLGASAAATSVPTIASGASPPTPTLPVYDIKATVTGNTTVRLDFTARRGGADSWYEVVGTAVSFGQDVNEAAGMLADILRPGSPEAAAWVLDTWLPQAIDSPEDPPEKSYLGKTALYYNDLEG